MSEDTQKPKDAEKPEELEQQTQAQDGVTGADD